MIEAPITILHISITDWLMITAVLFSPWIALFIQGWLMKQKESRSSKLIIFKTLMATRLSPLSFEHIQALNMIDIEFYGNKKYKAVRSAWRNYLDIRVDYSQISKPTEAQQLQFDIECKKTITALLVHMGEVLGYDFDESHIRQSVYKPEGHVTEERYQMFMRESLFKMFTGELTLPISVNSLPVSEENMNNQKKFIELATKYLEKQLSDAGALEIKQEIP